MTRVPTTMEKLEWEESVVKRFLENVLENVLSEFGKLEIRFQQSNFGELGLKTRTAQYVNRRIRSSLTSLHLVLQLEPLAILTRQLLLAVTSH